MGGLRVNPGHPAPWYEMEMLNDKSQTVAMHFKVCNSILKLRVKGHKNKRHLCKELTIDIVIAVCLCRIRALMYD